MAFNLLFSHPEEGKYFTEVVNFIYTLEKFYKKIEDSKVLKGFYTYGGNIVCNQCDCDEDECECDDREFDFGEAEFVVDAFIELYENMSEEISELNTSDHDCLEFTYKHFKPLLNELDDTIDEHISSSVNDRVLRKVEDCAGKYNQELSTIQPNSMPNINLSRK